MISKVLIVSDSHGKNIYVKKAIDREKPDMLIHLGDIEGYPDEIREWLDAAMQERREQGEEVSLPVPAVFIRGNCDNYNNYDLKSSQSFELNGVRFFATHGHRQEVSYGYHLLVKTAKMNGCKVAFYVHTHRPYDGVVDGIRVVNPGSIALPRGHAGKSYMIMTFTSEKEFEIELKEL